MRKMHYGNVDENGNYRGRSRKSDGYLEGINNDLPFAALVTAWHPKSQTIEVVRPIPNGNINYDSVVVYGNFFEATGTIQGPKIATTLKDDGFTTYRDKDQVDPSSDDYVLDNHIEALVFPVSVGNTVTYAAQSFRFLTADSPLLNNVKEGRKITRHDDGSFYIHDEDGNFQFHHPSGLNFKAGDNPDDIELDEAFPPHEKNVTDYADDITIAVTIPNSDGDHKLISDSTGIYLEHKEGGQAGYDNANKLVFSNIDGALKTVVLDEMLDHQTAALGYTDDFLTEYIVHIHPCIVPTGVPTNAANAVTIQTNVQLEITGVSTTKTNLGKIMA